MPETIRCPDCGRENPATADACVHCSFPLGPPAAAPEAPDEPAPAGGGHAPHAPYQGPLVRGFQPGPRGVRPIRTRRPRAQQPLQMQLWLLAGIVVALTLAWSALHGFWTTNYAPIAGAHADQEKRADDARAALAKDSTNVDARIALANVLFDTANWSEAIVHYRSALRLDPSRATTIVDMGVCYYNLSAFPVAESLFHAALALDPHQPVALFNLGVVAESRQQWEPALKYFHQAMQTDPPESMKQPLLEHMQNVMQKLGKAAPPISTP